MMVVYYKKNGEDTRIEGVDWVDTFMVENGKNTAVIHIRRADTEVEIPLEDLVSITDN